MLAAASNVVQIAVGRPCTVRVAANITDVEDLVLSQENDPQESALNKHF